MTLSGVNRDLHLGDQKGTWKKLVHGSSGNDIISSYPNPSPRKTSKHLLRRHSDPKNIPKTPFFRRYVFGCLGTNPSRGERPVLAGT